MKTKTPWRKLVLVALAVSASAVVSGQSLDQREGVSGGAAVVAIDAEALGPVIERALARYLDTRGIRLAPNGELAGLIEQELMASHAPAVAPAPRQATGDPAGSPGAGYPRPRGIFNDDVELVLKETGSGSTDKVQLVFSTPEFSGAAAGNAWSIIVEAADTADPDDGKLFFSTPSFFDALQLFTDGTAIVGDLREFRILPSSSPPIACTSFLQEGRLYWDNDIGALCACDGSGWAPVDSDETGSCS